jgi:anaphase-promoting complex subunit 2
MDHQSLVFASVFPVPSLSHTTPTPIATPDLGHAAPGQSFGSPFVKNDGGENRAVRRNLAWSTATRFLSLPRPSAGADAPSQSQRTRRTQDVEDALEYLLVGEGRSKDGNEESLVEWYTHETTLHFASQVAPRVTELWEKVLTSHQLHHEQELTENTAD